jgi:hypothetical protein
MGAPIASVKPHCKALRASEPPIDAGGNRDPSARIPVTGAPSVNTRGSARRDCTAQMPTRAPSDGNAKAGTRGMSSTPDATSLATPGFAISGMYPSNMALGPYSAASE